MHVSVTVNCLAGFIAVLESSFGGRLFTCGIATLLQVLGTRYLGTKLPVVLGCTFTAVGPIIAVSLSSNLATVYGAIIISGLFVLLAAPLFGKLLRFFPTVVTGSVVTIIGLSLIPVAMNNAAGGQGSRDFGQPRNLLLALGTLVIILLINRFCSGFIRAICAARFGCRYGCCLCSWYGELCFRPRCVLGKHRAAVRVPQFNLAAILTMILVNIISMVESTGVYFALGKVTEKEVNQNDIVKGLRAEGVAIMLGGFFNAFPYTAFSQNVGLVALTRVKTSDVIIAAGGILVVLGLLPKLAALTTVIPNPVLGGAMIAMFGMVVASGINILSNVDLRQQENLLIAACSIGVGLGSAAVPQMFDQLPTMAKMLLQNGIVTGSVTAVALNILLLHHKQKKTNEPPVQAPVVSEIV